MIDIKLSGKNCFFFEKIESESLSVVSLNYFHNILRNCSYTLNTQTIKSKRIKRISPRNTVLLYDPLAADLIGTVFDIFPCLLGVSIFVNELDISEASLVGPDVDGCGEVDTDMLGKRGA